MNLPRVKAPIRLPNKNYEEIDGDCYHYEIHEVEVLTINLNSGTMRVRDPNKFFSTRDIPNTPFFEQYEIKRK